MAAEFLGVGWGFPVDTVEGAVVHAAHEESIAQAIRIVLGTVKGERVMRPDFGCGIHDLVFERNTAATAGRVTSAVRDALLLHEPRIEVVDVEVEPRGEAELVITVAYRVRATNNVFNLVFPFYLEQGGTR